MAGEGKMESYYFRCGDSVVDTRRKIDEAIRQWLTSKELMDIVEAFGGGYPNTSDNKKLAGWLLEFSENWDYRKKQKEATDAKTGEAARWLVKNDSISEEQGKAVFRGIDKLGLRNVSKPYLESYDYIVALGGARMSCLFRPRYVGQLISQMKSAPESAVMLSGMRPVADTERTATDTYAPGEMTEYDLINAGVEKTFNLEKEYEERKYCHPNANRSWAIRTYVAPQYDFKIQSVSGPSSDPETRRANSADTFAFFVKKEQINPHSKILLVTSQIYVPYQQLEAVRTWAIPNDVYVETVGFPTEWNVNQQGMMETANYLQEIRSTIQAVNRYLKEFGTA